MEIRKSGLPDGTYLRIIVDEGEGRKLSYGGSQKWFEKTCPSVAAHGCGLIALADLILYARGRRRVRLDEYKAFVMDLYRRPDIFFEISVLRLGLYVPTLVLVAAKELGLALPRGEVRWNLRPGRLSRMEEMLGAGLPVILEIGKCLPGKGLPLYRDAAMKQASGRVSDHYLTVTGVVRTVDRGGKHTLLQVSTWGEKRYISCGDLNDYIASTGPLALRPLSELANNFLYIKTL